jgi:hypothetical protein
MLHLGCCLIYVYYSSWHRCKAVTEVSVKRTAILVLFLFAGSCCHSLAQAPFHFEWQTQNPSTTKPELDLDKLFSRSVAQPFTPLDTLILPRQHTAQWSEDARIDPKMIVRPPQASLGLQQGIPRDQSQFANLQMLPIDSPSAGVNAIPAQWPSLKVQAIPTQWPRLEVHPVE